MRAIEDEREERDEKESRQRVKTPDKALQDLMRYAARAERSSGDALRLMRRWGIGEVDRRQILEKLQRQHFIDDERFAEAYVREKTRLAGWGIHKIRAGLRMKGIAPALIERVTQVLSDQRPDNKQRLAELLARKRRSLKEADVYKVKDKLIRFGISRGFDYEDVADVVQQVLQD